MDVLRIALIVLALACIWALVELALTIHKTRSTVKKLTEELTEITSSANETIEQLQPMLAKVDGMVDDLGPAVAQITPLVEKASTAIDVVTVDLASVNDILVDVSSVTDTASNVTSTVSKAANSAVSGVAGVVGKFTGSGKPSRRRRLNKSNEVEMAPDLAPAPAPAVIENAVPEVKAPEPAPTTGEVYFTYGSSDTQGGE